MHSNATLNVRREGGNTDKEMLMAVLLLAYGDPNAKTMLRNAIQTRYGLRPPVLDSLHLDFKGRTRAKVGPVIAWVPFEASAYFQFPAAMRWDFTVRPMGLPVQRGVEAFQDDSFRTARGKRTAMLIKDTGHINYLRRRLWAIAAVLLTPLGDSYVRLSVEGERRFHATNTQTGDTVTLDLRADHSVEQVAIPAVNPDTGASQLLTMKPSSESVELDGLMLPQSITMYWDDEQTFDIQPIAANQQYRVPTGLFALDKRVAG